MNGRFSFNSLFLLKFDIFFLQLQYGFSEAGSMLMLSNMVGGRCVAFFNIIKCFLTKLMRYKFLDWWHARVSILIMKLSSFPNYRGNP